MKNVIFNSNECVEIKSKEQYNEICHVLRNSKPINHDLQWPIYLEHANSVTRGSSIGYRHTPEDTWTGEPLKVISFEEATNRKSAFLNL